MTQSIGELEEFIGCTLNHDLTNTTLNISQPHIITNMSQGYNEGIKSIINFNTKDKTHKGIVGNQENTRKFHTVYRRDTGVA